jgi:hypothetical protein
MHDWDVKNNQLKFHAHSGESGEKHDILIITED